jgi:SAM-dependent methyltransferase
MTSELLDVIVKHGIIDQDTVDMWLGKLFRPALEGVASWDPILFEEWNKEPRTDFESISRFYNSDMHVVFQASMMGSWEATNLPEGYASYIHEGMRVLDYGSGSGRTAFSCLKNGADVTICDVSDKLLNACKLLAESYGHSLTTVLIDQEVPQLPDGFDFVVTVDCLEHVKYPVEVLDKMLGSLVQGGYIWNEVCFGGHDLSPYHLVEVRHFGVGTTWHDILRSRGLSKIDSEGYLWLKAVGV